MEQAQKEERYKIIPGFSRYKVTKSGTFINIQTKSVLLPDPHNYGRIRMFNDSGKRTWIDPIKLSAEIWPESGNVRHIKDPEVKAARKVQKPGKVTEDQVREMRALYDAGKITKRGIEERYGICQQTAGKIVRRVYYPNIV